MKLVRIFSCLFCLTLVCDIFSQSASAYYFTRYDIYNRYVYSRNLDGTNESSFTLSVRPKPIAVDWQSSPKKLYIGLVPESGTCTIIRCNLDGSGPENVLTGLVNVNDIELDLLNRKIYWLQNTFDDDKVYKADMDALNSNITFIYSTTVTSRELWGLALDVPSQLLWITERGSNFSASYIRRMTTTGASLTTIKNPVSYPHDIEYFNNKIYWGDNDGIKTANSNGSSESTIYAGADADGVAIDGTNNAVLWVDFLTGEVKRVDIAGTNYAVHTPSHSTISGIDTDYNPHALPVELSSFNAKLTEAGVALRWTTATEINNFGFEIERALKPEEGGWEKIGFVNGSGNSNSLKEYSFADPLNLNLNLNLRYRLKQIDNDGSFTYSKEVEIDNLRPLSAAGGFDLLQNYPNPFNPATVISYRLQVPGHVTLKLIDVLGNEVAVLVDATQESGNHDYKLSTLNYKLTSGVYFYKLQAGDFVSTKKMILLK
ncbi:MAG: T9SS type A sorting domain-containing protein [Ignavibacteriaceae bacterium]